MQTKPVFNTPREGAFMPGAKIMALLAMLTVVMLSAGVAIAHESDSDAATLESAQSEVYGTHLVTADGMSVYVFKADTRGSDKSACYGKCAENWPPVTTTGSVQVKGAANADMLDTIKRDDGSTQVTYNGRPLYLFFKDKAPGDTNGQDVKDVWYLIAPDGSIVHAEEDEDAQGN